MNTELKSKIEKELPHIDFTVTDMDQWFFETFLPFLVLNWMGEIEPIEGSVWNSFDTRTLDAIKEDFDEWKEVACN